jgi:hypothetical protein
MGEHNSRTASLRVGNETIMVSFVLAPISHIELTIGLQEFCLLLMPTNKITILV